MSKLDRSRYCTFVIYPDDVLYAEQLALIYNEDNYILSLHDKDYDDNGEIKKAHYHVIIKRSEASTASAYAKYFQLCNADGKAVSARVDLLAKKGLKSVVGAYRYLIHYDNYDKAQYDFSNVQGTLLDEFNNAILSSSVKKTMEEITQLLLNYIFESDFYITLTDLTKYAMDFHGASVIRSSTYFWEKMLLVHNEKYRRNKEKAEMH